jgi:CHAT domain-containing protein
LIWKPLEKYLQNVNTIYMAPAGMMHQLSFSAIPTPDGKMLSDKYNINIVSSTRNLIEGNKDEIIAQGNAVVYGGIKYNADSTLADILATVHAKEKSEMRSLLRGTTSEESWSYLPGTLQEAKSVNTILAKKKIKVEYISDVNATEESFKKLSDNSPQILHIATHGFTIPLGDKNNAYKVFDNPFVQNFNPLFRTGLLFAGANRTWNKEKPIEGIEDGVLTAYEVSNLNLRNTKLVVLSACETGLGETKGSEGVYGLQRSFKAAGVKYIMMTLWTIPDEQTVELMTLFYEKITSGKPIRKAFTETQNEMKKKYPPYFWAGFVLVE